MKISALNPETPLNNSHTISETRNLKEKHATKIKEEQEEVYNRRSVAADSPPPKKKYKFKIQVNWQLWK